MSLVTYKNINYHLTDSIKKQNKERRENCRPTFLGGWQAVTVILLSLVLSFLDQPIKAENGLLLI